MGRIRTIKPQFFKHHELYQAEVDAHLPLRLAFAGLWTICDRDGRFRWKPHDLKPDVLPHDAVDFRVVMDALAAGGFVVRYRVEGVDYGCIPSWHTHQRVHKREPASLIPPQPILAHIPESPVDVPPLSVQAPEMAVGTPSPPGMEGKGKEGKGKEGKGKEESTTTTTESVAATSTLKPPAPPTDVVVDESVRQGLEVQGRAGAQTDRITEEKSEAVDFEKVSPKDWPKAEVERVARTLAPLIWSNLHAQAQYETYRTSGAVNDVNLVCRWLAHGFTPAEIKGALAQAGITTSTTVTNPLAFMGKVAPVLLDRMRRTGSYEEVRAAAAPAATRPMPEGQAAEGFDDGDYIAKRNEQERASALRHLPIWIKGGKRRWNSWQYGTAPGTTGSHITAAMVHDAEIEMGVRSD